MIAPKALPRVTIRILFKSPLKVISLEKKKATGKVNILAMLCSNPEKTKVKTQKILGKNLPTISWDVVASQMPKQTRKLQPIALKKSIFKEVVDFISPIDSKEAIPLSPKLPREITNKAKRRAPMRFKKKTKHQFLSSATNLTSFSR